MHYALNGFTLLLVLSEDVVQSVKVHDIVLVEIDSFVKLLCWDFLADNLFDSWEDIGEAIGQVIDDDALKLGVFEDLDEGVGSDEAEAAGDEEGFELWHKGRSDNLVDLYIFCVD